MTYLVSVAVQAVAARGVVGDVIAGVGDLVNGAGCDVNDCACGGGICLPVELGVRCIQIADANQHIAAAYGAPLSQMTDAADFDRLHQAVQREHRAIAARAALVNPAHLDLCQAMLRDWTAGMAVGARHHRHEVDDASFDSARDRAFGTPSLDGHRDLFLQQLQARGGDRARIDELRAIVNAQPADRSASAVLAALRPDLDRLFPGAVIEADHEALTLVNTDGDRGRRQDNRERTTMMGIEYVD